MTRKKALGMGIVVILAVLAVGVSVTFGFDRNKNSSAQTEPTKTAEAVKETTTPTPTQTPTPTATPTPTKTATPTPTPTALLAPGSKSDKVRDLQARMKQIGWYETKISGVYDSVTETGIRGFQGKRELPQTGEVDQKTWDALTNMTRKPTDDEMHNRITAGPTILGPGDKGDKVRELQARLRQIGWMNGNVTPNYGSQTAQAVRGFQGKRELPQTGEVDQKTWDALTNMTRKPTDDEMHNREPEKEEKEKPSAAIDPRCASGRTLCIDKTTRTLRWVIDGKVQTSLNVRFGSELTPTREGAFQVQFKSRDHVSSLYDTPMPYAMFFSGGQAVHYSPDFAANGYNGSSHGCVNVRDKGAIAAIFNKTKVGDKVIVYRS